MTGNLQNCRANGIDGESQGDCIQMKHGLLESESLKSIAVDKRFIHHARHQRQHVVSAESLAENCAPGLPFLLRQIEHVGAAADRLEETR